MVEVLAINGMLTELLMMERRFHPQQQKLGKGATMRKQVEVYVWLDRGVSSLVHAFCRRRRLGPSLD